MASIVCCLVGSAISACAPSPECRLQKHRPTATDRRPEATTEKIDQCTTKDAGTVREQLAKEANDGHDDDGRKPRAANDDEIKIVVAVPGVRIEDVSVEVLDNVLRVTGE